LLEPFLKNNITAQGWWIPPETPRSNPESPNPETGFRAIKAAIEQVTQPVFLVKSGDEVAAARGGSILIGDVQSEKKRIENSLYRPLLAYSPALHPENLGDPVFKKRNGLRYAYIAGAMANGITSVKMVEEAGRAGMLGFFGAAGLSLPEVADALEQLQKASRDAGGFPFGFNLIHSPNEPDLEMALADLYLKRGLTRISASAFMDMTLPLIYFRVKGIRRDPQGNIVCPNKVFAKVSRLEVARKFFSPPPEKLLAQLLEKRMITKEEADLARLIPVAEELTAEADSGGHTDNRPAISLLPTMLALRDELAAKYRYEQPLCVGLGGGIATPESAAAAFAMGAAYILTGSVNQACVEAGTSEIVRKMLAEARQADVIMAPAADMFELGVKVQVLKRGTMFPFRAAKLYEMYCKHSCFEEIPEPQQKMLERDFFRCSFQEEWDKTKKFFAQRDPAQILRAEKDSKHKMALVFRSYLGQSSRWATSGEPSRVIDYQIWCGPALGAFNEWAKGSFLEKPENRKTVTVAMNLLFGASVVTRANWLRCQNVILPAGAGKFSPTDLSKIRELIEN